MILYVFHILMDGIASEVFGKKGFLNISDNTRCLVRKTVFRFQILRKIGILNEQACFTTKRPAYTIQKECPNFIGSGYSHQTYIMI